MALSDDPTYRSWHSMKTRCTNPRATDYYLYGGRGIAICDRWLRSFEAFKADMGERPPGMSIERNDNDGNYEPGNCRWATAAEQQHNTIRAVVTPESARAIVRWTREGETLETIASALGLSKSTVYAVQTGLTWSTVTGVPKKTRRPPGRSPTRRNHRWKLDTCVDCGIARRHWYRTPPCVNG